MATPILTIDNFAQGLSYDETEATTSGFNDLVNIDIKSVLGVAQLSKYFSSGNSNTAKPKNRMEEYSFIPDVSFTGTTQALFQKGGTTASDRGDVYLYDTYTKNSSLLYSVGTPSSPIYGECKIFNNRLFFSTSMSNIGSISFWTGGQTQSVKIPASGATIRIEPPLSNTQFQPFLKNMEGGTLYYYDRSWQTATISTVTPDSNPYTGSTVVLSATPSSTGNFYGYAMNSSALQTKRNDGTILSLNNVMPRNTVFYRPMINFINNLYIGDGDMICQIDNLLATFNATGSNGSISVGSDYVVKQFEKIGGYMYILADKVSQAYNNTFSSQGGRYTRSRLYIWDGISNEFTQSIDIGAHCFSIKAIENRIYATIQSSNQDGVLFAYFNGSDFPTIAKFQIPFADCPVNCISYDRGRFYVAVNTYDSSNVFQGATMFAYSSYAIDTPSVSKEYAVVSTDTKYKIDGLDYLNEGADPLLLMFDNISGSENSYIRYRSKNTFFNVGYLKTQKYEITPNQFGQLVRGVQINCKESMPANSYITFSYKGDEETSFTTLPTTITSANQNSLVWGIMRRYRKIQIIINIVGPDNASPAIIKIMLF